MGLSGPAAGTPRLRVGSLVVHLRGRSCDGWFGDPYGGTHAHRQALGALAGFEATELGGLAIKAALERAGLAPDQVDYVFMGQVLLGRRRTDARPARPPSTPASR